MPDKIRMRRGNFANLPTLDDGEIGLSEDTKTVYIGSTTGNVKLAMATIETVIGPTLLNSWVNFGSGYQTAGYYKDNFGVVHLVGFIKSGTAVLNTTLFNLPSGYRPLMQCAFSIYTNDGANIGTLQVAPGGAVNFISGNNANFSLNGAYFRTT